MTRYFASLSFLLLTFPAFGQAPVGTNVTGKLTKARTTNAMTLAQAALLSATSATPRSVDKNLLLSGDASPLAARTDYDALPIWTGIRKRLHPSRGATRSRAVERDSGALSESAVRELGAIASISGLPVSVPSNRFGFDGLTHLQQRNANRGNQFSVEPPNPSIGVSSRYVLQGVNNAVMVYSLTGTALLPAVISSNELFGVTPAIDRVTGLYGVYPTDMRVLYDHSLDRFLVIQRAQDYDPFSGDPIGSSKIYIAITKTNDPTGDYDIYILDTSDAETFGCPCVADYPMIAFDQHGLHISSNEYTVSEQFVRAQIHSIAKADLATSKVTPTTWWTTLPFTTGYEFAVHPAMTPPGASYFTASGGVMYFVASQSRISSDSKMMIWALSNTQSLNTASPNLPITFFLANTLEYTRPNNATQKEGSRPYGNGLPFPGALPEIDGGDTRVQSVSYSGGRLWVTLATAVSDNDGTEVVGGAFVIFSPTIRASTLNAVVLRQGYFGVRGNHLLRSAVAVNAQGRGAIAATITGPDYYPGVVYLPIDTFTGPTSVRLVADGFLPEDGFTGYQGGFGPGTARWGDYATSVIAPDGSFWTTVEYIPNLPRFNSANWGAYITRFVP